MSLRSTRCRIVLLLGLSFSLGAYPPPSAGKTYKGAEYRTIGSYLYGRFEVRSRAIGREGTLSSFFTYNDDYPNTEWNEIDIEILGRYTDDVQFNAITAGQANHLSHQWVSFNPAFDYHVYGFEWTPTSVAWFIDSVEILRQTGPHIATLTLPQKIMMNVWNPVYTDWVGKWDERVLPAFAFYDWVRYSSYTPGTGTAGTDNNFTPQWIDNFDSLDQARWEIGVHTFGGNNCDFVLENAVFQDGKLILCLTKDTPLGYVDNVAPSVRWARVDGNSVRIMFSEELEQAGAETKSNYVIPKATVAAAHLLADRMSVLLDVPGLDTVSTTAMIVQNVRDLWTPANPMKATGVLLIRPAPAVYPLKLNVGGSAYGEFLPDTVWSEYLNYGRLDGSPWYVADAQIGGTSEQEVYRSEAVGPCEYKVRVPNGWYHVVLMMADLTYTEAGKRLMTIVVEGFEVETGLDLVARAGYRVAYTKALDVEVIDGTIDIHMQGVVDVPVLSGLTVMPLQAGINELMESPRVPGGITLFPNYPNPFNGGTTISFFLPREDQLTLRIFDPLGREVQKKSLGAFAKGYGRVFWDARNGTGAPVASGVYYYRVDGKATSKMQPLVYVK
jgi:hypothetical protein